METIVQNLVVSQATNCNCSGNNLQQAYDEIEYDIYKASIAILDNINYDVKRPESLDQEKLFFLKIQRNQALNQLNKVCKDLNMGIWTSLENLNECN